MSCEHDWNYNDAICPICQHVETERLEAEIELLRAALQFVANAARADGIDHLASFCEQALNQQSTAKVNITFGIEHMAENFNPNHLLWWVMKAIHCCRADGTRPDTLLSETMWKNIGAPAWVLPAMREKYDQFDWPRS